LRRLSRRIRSTATGGSKELQQQGVYLSASAIYGYLREKGWVQAYERRAAPWKSPRYEVWQRNMMWGCDWTKLLVGGLRWYLLTVIDFFSRLIVPFDVVPTVHAGHIKAVYQAGLKGQGILVHRKSKPEFRVDRGSPNTSGITREFFEGEKKGHSTFSCQTVLAVGRNRACQERRGAISGT
jgi:transposase InsO family protein